jgi:DNA-binding CsgD family transcriptional regulator
MSRSRESKPRRARKGDPLTDREIQILSLVAAGEPTAAISERLGIAENTVKSHLTNIYAKTGSRNRVQATRHYLRHYTLVDGATAAALEPSVVEQQIREIQARLDQLAPAATEAQRLQHALDALRGIAPR